ncbi:mitochondrial cardiolipin hydrolase zuc [Xylocopa sonorina]|uniref:mitochondrial cardiolipin hydrolase zuc n=1 Tax=Xylocopa sonorina TaxID=1818115 RepID=UPI00403B181F
MKSNKILLVGGIVLSSELIWHIYKRFYKHRNVSMSTCKVSNVNDHEPKEKISEVMFFTEDSSLCRTHFISNIDCVKDNCSVRYLRKLESYINHAQQSLDVCMYILTCHLLATAIVNAHKRGVLVRVIMDRHMASHAASDTALFHNNGIAIKLEHLNGLMHHKFVIVDNVMVITGSTNWTMTAFFGNFDHVLVTNQRTLVKPFVDEFNRLWKTFSKSSENLDCLLNPSADNSS